MNSLTVANNKLVYLRVHKVLVECTSSKNCISYTLFQVHGKDPNVNGYDSEDSDGACSSTTTPSLVSPSSTQSGTTPQPQQQQQSQATSQQASNPTPQTIVSHSDWYCAPQSQNNSSTSTAANPTSSLPTPPSNEHSPVHQQQQQQQHHQQQQQHLAQQQHHLHQHAIGGLISAVQSTYWKTFHNTSSSELRFVPKFACTTMMLLLTCRYLSRLADCEF